MVYWVAIILFLLMGIVHVVGAYSYAFWTQRRRSATVDRDLTEHVACLISVRGFDPSIQNTLIGILNQDYRSYEVHIVVDGEVNELQMLIGQVGESRVPVFIHRLESPSSSCGLKCSALRQAISNLGNNAKILAMLDSDVVPQTDWLRTLTAPLSDEQIGVVSGGQWFDPAHANLSIGRWCGSWVRRLWNSGALVPSSLLGNPWAGSLAMRRADFDSANLLNVWERAIVDDGPIRKAMHGIGLKVYVEPLLTMINTETCDLPFVLSYVRRMLTWSRWYEPSFWNTAVHGAVMALGWLALLLALVSEAFIAPTRFGILVLVLLGGLALYAWSFCVVREAVRLTTRGNIKPMLRTSIGDFLGALLWVPLTHVAFVLGVIGAMSFQTIRWRGISYRIRGPENVEMLGYLPAPPGHDAKGTSL